MRKLLLSCSLLVALAGPAGCGGASDDDLPSLRLLDDRDQVLQLVRNEPAVPFTRLATALIDLALRNTAVALSGTAPCFDGSGAPAGSLGFTVTDADGSASVSAGDTVRITAASCNLDGHVLNGSASFTLSQLQDLAAWLQSQPSGAYTAEFRYETLRADGFAVAGPIQISESIAAPGGTRMKSRGLLAPQVVLSNGPFSQSLFDLDDLLFIDLDNDITRIVRSALRTSLSLADLGLLDWTRSLAEPIVFIGTGQLSRTGVIVYRADGVEVRIRFLADHLEVEVHNGRDGRFVFRFRVEYSELG